MTDVVDRHVEVLAPEERYCVERFTIAEDVSGRRLTLTLGYNPMLDADAVTRVRIRPSRDVSCREDARRAGFEVLADRDPAVDGEPGPLGQPNGGSDADAQDQEIGFHRRGITQDDRPSLEPLHRPAQVKDDPVALVQPADEAANLRTHDAFQRQVAGRHDMDGNVPRPE